MVISYYWTLMLVLSIGMTTLINALNNSIFSWSIPYNITIYDAKYIKFIFTLNDSIKYSNVVNITISLALFKQKTMSVYESTQYRINAPITFRRNNSK